MESPWRTQRRWPSLSADAGLDTAATCAETARLLMDTDVRDEGGTRSEGGEMS